jgi:hypothetical protein
MEEWKNGRTEDPSSTPPLFLSSTPGGGVGVGTGVAVWVGVWDVRGRVVRWLVEGEVQGPGEYQVVWDGKDEEGRDAASGVYLVRMKVREVTLIRKITLLW